MRVWTCVALLSLVTACNGGTDRKDIAAANADYVVVAWNDLGMHCLNPSYEDAVILPPYNTVWAQVVHRGNPPTLVTTGVTVEYAIKGNTYSYGKRQYGGFWDHIQQLFGATLGHDLGLNLKDPTRHNGLSGTMVAASDHFEVDGIPLTPVDDAGVWSPYQVATITVRDAGGQVLASTEATVPTSDEIDCAKCHGASALADVLVKHDAAQGTTLVASKPVLCASCHGSPALGATSPGSSGKFLSEAIHGFHADKGAVCYDCHPGATTQCTRSLAHTAPDGHCTTCHGSMADVAASVDTGARTPWAGEPKCSTCHPAISEVDTGTALYRNASGHGGLYCPACHGSPHAMIPSRVDSDNHQAIQYQSKDVTLGSCRVCHQTSRGGGSASEFADEHGGGGQPSACSVCHTGVPDAPQAWPHAGQWKTR